MEISRTYATKETTSSYSLLGYDHIESGLRLIPVSSPLEHIHHVLCQVVRFRYRSATLVGFRQLVIALHAVLSSESST